MNALLSGMTLQELQVEQYENKKHIYLYFLVIPWQKTHLPVSLRSARHALKKIFYSLFMVRTPALQN